VRRGQLLAAGGYAAAAEHMTDDAALARALARSGWRVKFVDGTALVEVRMYESAGETWREWGRSIALADVTTPAWRAADVAVVWLAQALPVLRLLAGRAGPVTAGYVGRELGLPRSTTYHLLGELIATGFVVHLPDEHRFVLGVAAFEVGTGFSRQEPLQRISRRTLTELVDRTGQTAHLAVLHGRHVLYVVEERAPGRPPLVTDVGVRLPAHLTASGRAILARLPPSQVRALYPNAAAFVDRHGSGPRTLGALRTVLQETRQRGYAVEHGEVTPGLASVAAAVLDHNGHPVAGVAVTYPAAPEADPEGLAATVEATRRTAAILTRRLGGA
jgi:DNA-binding IclR family transcriptional regulator